MLGAGKGDKRRNSLASFVKFGPAFSAYKSISDSISKFYSLNYYFKNYLYKNHFLYLFTLQHFFYISSHFRFLFFANKKSRIKDVYI